MAKQVKKYTPKKAVKSAKPVAKKVVAKKAPAKKSIFAKIKSIFGF